MTHTIKNQKEADAAKQKQEAQRRRELRDLSDLMDIAAGRRFLWRFLSDAKIFDLCFTGNSETFYRLGRKEFALKYFNDLLTACPDALQRMQSEYSQGAIE